VQPDCINGAAVYNTIMLDNMTGSDGATVASVDQYVPQTAALKPIQEFLRRRLADARKATQEGEQMLTAVDRRKRATIAGIRQDIERLRATVADTTAALGDIERLDGVAGDILGINREIAALCERKQAIYAAARLRGAMCDSALASPGVPCVCSVSVRYGHD
jgi:hypothetical protein